MKPDSTVAALIPALDAAASIEAVVHAARAQVEQVLVVDDGSRDATAERAAAAGAQVIRHPKNLGKGSALRTGFRHYGSLGTAGVWTLDADGQHLPSEYGCLLEPFRQGADLVLGVRDSLFRDMAGIRRWSNVLSSGMISRLAGVALPDTQTGFRIYRLDMIKALGFPEKRFDAESAVLVRAARAGYSLVMAPIELGFADGRSTSHYRPILDSLRIARSVVRARWASRKKPRQES